VELGTRASVVALEGTIHRFILPMLGFQHNGYSHMRNSKYVQIGSNSVPTDRPECIVFIKSSITLILSIAFQ